MDLLHISSSIYFWWRCLQFFMGNSLSRDGLPSSMTRSFLGMEKVQVPGLVNFHITNWKITMLLMGKSTILMVIFNSYVANYQRVTQVARSAPCAALVYSISHIRLRIFLRAHSRSCNALKMSETQKYGVLFWQFLVAIF